MDFLCEIFDARLHRDHRIDSFLNDPLEDAPAIALTIRPRPIRQLVAAKYDGSKRRGIGRPRTADELRALVVSMAIDNPTWGYARIRDVLRSLGRDIGRTTIQERLKEQGIEPAPTRRKRMSWKDFLGSHWGAIAACDFLSVERMGSY